MVLGVVKLYTYSVIVPYYVGHSHSLGREMMIKSGRGSLKVDVATKFSRALRAIIPTTPPH